MKLSDISDVDVPTVVRKFKKPAEIYVKYPNGDVWKYYLDNSRHIDYLDNKYSRNMGRYISALKNIAFDSQKVYPEDNS